MQCTLIIKDFTPLLTNKKSRKRYRLLYNITAPTIQHYPYLSINIPPNQHIVETVASLTTTLEETNTR